MNTPALRNIIIGTLAATASAGLLGGCAASLKPAADATRAAGGGATANSHGINIVTMTPDFPGIVDIESAVTPVKVRITNTGKASLLIRYSDFKLTGADGNVYPALPLRKIDATASVPLSGVDPVVSPAFRYNGFRVAPYYGGLYPGIRRFVGSFPYGYGRYGWDNYDAAFGGFANVQLPTPTMYRNVLPEGVLDPGGSLEGWLYFKHVGKRTGDISFDASLTSVTGASLGSLSIPYTFAK